MTSGAGYNVGWPSSATVEIMDNDIIAPPVGVLGTLSGGTLWGAILEGEPHIINPPSELTFGGGTLSGGMFSDPEVTAGPTFIDRVYKTLYYYYRHITK